MVTVEVYIVKEDNYATYEIRNSLGSGINSTEKVIDFLDLSTTVVATGTTPDAFKVSVNDYPVINLVDYYINTDDIMMFVVPLNIGDKLEIHDIVADDAKIVTKNSYNKNALFKLFTSLQKFKYNQTYEMSLEIGDKEFTNSFLSQYDPFYSNIKNIRNDTGDLLAGVTDSQIARIIYKNSKDVYTTLSDNSNLDVLTNYNYAQNVVRYRTDIDLCYAIYLSISGKYGVILKELGDIKIQREIKLPLIEAMIKRFKDLLAANEELLNGDVVMVDSFVKANATTYTVADRGVF